MTYPGGKNGAGVYQAIINQMPPHRRYIEPFVGGGAILLHKRPAVETHIADLNETALTAIYDECRRRGVAVQAHHTCGIAMLRNLQARRDDLVYCDPPYVWSTRTKTKVYDHEMTDADHARLLAAVTRLDCMVMLSGYDNLLYRAELADWRRVEYMAPTRGGPRPEVLWCNFPEPVTLHDYRYLGEDYRERERIARKVTRWRNKFVAMPELERRAVLTALLSVETAIHDRASPEGQGRDSGIAEGVERIQRDFSPSSSDKGTAGDHELGERPRHKAGFPQSAALAASGGAPWGTE